MDPLPLRLVRLQQLATRGQIDARPAAVLGRPRDDAGRNATAARDARGGAGDGRGHSAQGGRRLRRELLYAEMIRQERKIG